MILLENVYIIKKMSEDEVVRGIIWEKVPKADINCYPWDLNGYMPKTEARVVYTEKGFHAFLISYENEILATRVNMNDPVCRDSCMEFFFKPDTEHDGRYLNFELNPLGTLYLGIGKDRFESMKVADTAPEAFRIHPSVTMEVLKDFSGPFWSIQFFIPFDFIERFYGKLNFKSGMKMAGNFYKCAEDTAYPHFGCWNEVISKVPDFHRPECFGSLILE